MQHAVELLDHAQRLLHDPGPGEWGLRRAASAAYYAVFHLLTSEAAMQIASSAGSDVHARLSRGFQHRDILKICQMVTKAAPNTIPQFFLGLVSGPFQPGLKRITTAFQELQELRHQADYDLQTHFGLIESSSAVAYASACFTEWPGAKTDPGTTVFLIALFAGDRLGRRG